MTPSSMSWLLTGLLVGPLWGLYARWLGVLRTACVLAAPTAVLALVLPWLAVNRSIQDIWTLQPLLIVSVPACITTFVVVRRRTAARLRWTRALTAVALVPGVVLLALGLRPGDMRFPEEVLSVERAAPRVEQYMRQHHRCPDFGDVRLDLRGEVHFHCEGGVFGFCITRLPYEEPVQCWNSVTGMWWFERGISPWEPALWPAGP